MEWTRERRVYPYGLPVGLRAVALPPGTESIPVSGISACAPMAPRTLPVVLRPKRVIRAANIQSVKIPRCIERHTGTGMCPSDKGASDEGKR